MNHVFRTFAVKYILIIILSFFFFQFRLVVFFLNSHSIENSSMSNDEKVFYNFIMKEFWPNAFFHFTSNDIDLNDLSLTNFYHKIFLI